VSQINVADGGMSNEYEAVGRKIVGKGNSRCLEKTRSRANVA
jgi:hypothetical protein